MPDFRLHGNMGEHVWEEVRHEISSLGAEKHVWVDLIVHL
jgi:hypothetical protein